jgi:hypothetical protein
MWPPMGTMAANWKKRGLRYVAVFWAAFQTKSGLACTRQNGCAGDKEQ